MDLIFALGIFIAAITVAGGTYCDKIPKEDLDLDTFLTKHSGKLITYKTISTADICSRLFYNGNTKELNVTNPAGQSTNYTIEKIREGVWHGVTNGTGQSIWFHTFAWGETETGQAFICLKECDCEGGYTYLKFLKCHMTSKEFIPRVDHILKTIAPVYKRDQIMHECDTMN